MTRPRLLFKNGVHLNAVPQLSWCYVNGIKVLMICLLDDGRSLVLFVHLCSWQFLFYILSCLLKDVCPSCSQWTCGLF